MSVAGLDEFNARVNRINGGANFTRATIYVGLEESFIYSGGLRQAVPASSGFRQVLGTVLSHLAAGITGFVAFGLMLLLRCHFGVNKDQGAWVSLGLDIIGALLVAVACAQVLRLTQLSQRVTQLAAICITVLTWHNLVHLNPAFFSQLFTPVWVGQVLNGTEARSIMLNTLVLRF
jgi:hypothetical protein